MTIAETALFIVCILWNEAEIRRNGFDFFVRHLACDSGHRPHGGRMISFAPFPELPLQVVIGESPQTGECSDTFSIGTVTRNAGWNVGSRYSILVNDLTLSC